MPDPDFQDRVLRIVLIDDVLPLLLIVRILRILLTRTPVRTNMRSNLPAGFAANRFYTTGGRCPYARTGGRQARATSHTRATTRATRAPHNKRPPHA
jgi:hypothetical protein